MTRGFNLRNNENARSIGIAKRQNQILKQFEGDKTSQFRKDVFIGEFQRTGSAKRANWLANR